jgi:hypothetical protein
MEAAAMAAAPAFPTAEAAHPTRGPAAEAEGRPTPEAAVEVEVEAVEVAAAGRPPNARA